MDSLSTIDFIGVVLGILTLILVPTVLITFGLLRYKANKKANT